MPLLLVTAAYIALYFVLRLPTSFLPLAYYDDGETLYQTLVLLKGGILYRDSVCHHFLGYILPFYLLAHLTDFSLALIRQVAFVNQVLSGLGVYLVVSMLRPKSVAFLAGLLCLAAREPTVLGFSPFYQMNLLLIFIIYFAIKSYKSISNLYISALLAGVALTFDQRAVFFSIIPGLVVLLRRQISLIPKLSISYLVAPILALLYLWRNQALKPFIEQTWIYPRDYRVGSSSLSDLIEIGIANYRYLISLTPLLCACAIAGYLALIRISKRETDPFRRSASILLALAPLSLIPIPFLSGRDFDYYSLNWIPYMAIISAMGMSWFMQGSKLLRLIYPTALIAQVALSLLITISQLKEPKITEYKGDGIGEVAAFLNDRLTADDTFYLWGYRLELYARLNRLAPNPFANPLMIHPDSQVTGAEREKHIFTPYSQNFIATLKSQPPSYIVTFDREARTSNATSPAKQALFALISDSYEKVYELTRKDFLDVDCVWRVYQRVTNVRNSSS